MQRIKRFISTVLVLAMAFSFLPTVAFAKQEQLITITILATSDIHGKIYPWEYATDLPQEYGLAKIATLIKQERAKDSNAILIDNGDSIESNMINLFNDEDIHPMINSFNLLKYDTWTLGNHEFNFGLDVLNKAIKSFGGQTVSANIVKEDSGETFVNPYYIKEVKGLKIGILGITTPHIPRWEASTPEHFANLRFEDPLSTVEKYVDILKNTEKCDIIIGTFHLGKQSENYNPDLRDSVKEIAEKVSGIDAIVAGHAHDTLGDAKNQLIYNNTIVLEPSSDGKFLGVAKINILKDDKGIQVVSKNTDLLSTANITPDQEILDAMKYVDDRSKEAANKVIGTATADFLPAETVKGIPIAQLQDTAVVDLINEVQLFYSKADISAAALFDSRSDLKAGELRFKDAALIYKYSNTLQSHKISGKNLKEYMEWSAGYYNTQKPGDVTVSFNEKIRAYNYDMFSGVDYKIDITKPAGDRVVDLTYKDAPLDLEKEYILAVNNYRVGTLQSLKLLPADGSSLVYDSTLTPTPEMQRLIQKYISEEKKGTISPVVNNNWSIAGVSSDGLEGAKEAIELVNRGIIILPTSEDGRTPNVASINVLEKMTQTDIDMLCEKAGLKSSAIKGTDLSNGQVYSQMIALLPASAEAAVAKAPETKAIEEKSAEVKVTEKPVEIKVAA